MPTIDDLQYGYDSAGVTQYLDDIKADSLEKAKKAVLETSEIKKVCENEWEGASRDKFVANLDEDAQFVANQFDALYEVLEGEINQVLATMANNDQKLMGK